MKKLLIATTALVGTASVAAADVTFSGYGRFSLDYEEDRGGTTGDDTVLDNRFRLDIRGTTETDGGVEFTARIRIESNDGDFGVVQEDNEVVEAPEFGVSSGGFSFFVGDTSDTLDSGDIVDFYGNSTALGFNFGELSSGFDFDLLPASGFGNEGPRDPVVKVTYAIEQFTVSASYQANQGDDSREEYMIGARYDFSEAIGAGLVLGNVDDGAGVDSDFFALGVDGSVGAIGYDVLIADADDLDDTAFGVGLYYGLSAATDLRFVVNDTGIDGDDTAYSVGFRHSLGGGVTLGGGIGVDENENDVADLGVQFNF